MDQISICPLKRLYQTDPPAERSRAAALVVSSYDIREERLEGFPALLTMCFADTTLEDAEDALTLRQAEQIKTFLDGLPAQLERLYICCDSGESRSPAMAAAILRYQKRDEWSIWKNPRYHPNPLVYQRLCKALGIRVWRWGLRRRIQCSARAFRHASQQRRK